ncbi:hypothetical protein ACFVXG_45515, partial [Kitasatospora sp. NPDC058162]|uniref:hypothetical protein n=1 Tax=Kitasatospora sp. NPDC058162 TaxID=3346362 RepID=UPI0036DBE70C
DGDGEDRDEAAQPGSGIRDANSPSLFEFRFAKFGSRSERFSSAFSWSFKPSNPSPCRFATRDFKAKFNPISRRLSNSSNGPFPP